MGIVSENNDQVKNVKSSTNSDQNLYTEPHRKIISRQNSTSSDISVSLLESVLIEKDDNIDTNVDPSQSESRRDKNTIFKRSINDMSLSPQSHQSPRIIIPSGYDSDRIPGSVFGSKTASPMEWSFASNESLFSLHMGNTSFSKDQFMLMYKSGELPKFDPELARFSGVMSNDQYNLASEVFDQSYSEITHLGLSKERDRFDWSYNNTPPTFQFPLLFGGYDGTIVTSPTMEPKRHWTTEKKHQSRPLGQIMHERDRPQRFEAKREHHHTSNWLLCFTCWFKPCHRCMAYLN